MWVENGFDIWADEYDEEVSESDRMDAYPFAGYFRILNDIFEMATEKKEPTVLDLGFGTGVLTSRLYDAGCRIYGQDFSSRMIEIASQKMPEAHLYKKDLLEGIAEPLKERRYDFIIATYYLHHLDDAQKITLIEELKDLLEEDGTIIIGDVAFDNLDELERCKGEAGEEWDDEEIYIVADRMKEIYPDLVFRKISRCGGIVILKKPMI